MHKFFMIITILIPVFCAELALPVNQSYAQSPMSIVGEKNEDPASDESDKKTEKNQENENSKDSENVAPLGIGNALHLDSFIDRWENQFNLWSADLGLSGSTGARAVMTGIIVIVTLILLWLVGKLVNLLRGKLVYVAQRIHISERKLNFLYGALYWLFAGIVMLISVISVGVTWGLDINTFILNDWTMGFFRSLLTFYVLIFLAIILLEVATGLVEITFQRWGGTSVARINTLLPIAKNTVYIVLVVMFSLVGLSEIGIDVMPLLAGAGVIGFAIGFAAQTFIKDLLMGFIVILEDLIQVGDVARVADRAGVVERITIRKVQLRDLSGSVFTVPFSEISIVENLTKVFSCAVFDIGIAYRENVDEVMELLKKIGEDMQNADEFKDEILEPLEIFGLDQFADSAVIIKARFKTKPIKQWLVSREFNRRIKIAFDEHGIEIPFPHQTIYFGEDKEGNSPPLRLSSVDTNQSAANEEMDTPKDDKEGSPTVTSKSLPNENEIDDDQ